MTSAISTILRASSATVPLLAIGGINADIQTSLFETQRLFGSSLSGESERSEATLSTFFKIS